KRIREIDAPSVAADFDHLGPAVESFSGLIWVGRTADDTSDLDGAGELRVKGIRYVVLPKFAGAPTRNIEKPVIQGQFQVGHKRGHGFESLQQGRKNFRVCRLGRYFNHLTDLEFAVAVVALSVPKPDRR